MAEYLPPGAIGWVSGSASGQLLVPGAIGLVTLADAPVPTGNFDPGPVGVPAGAWPSILSNGPGYVIWY